MKNKFHSFYAFQFNQNIKSKSRLLFYSFLFDLCFLFFAFCIIFFSSCQKVINIDLNTTAPQLVIEAPLYEGTNDFIVAVTKTSNYFGSDSASAVNNATVTFKATNQLNEYTLQSIGKGKYKLQKFNAVSNQEYKLSVTADGKTYEASSFMSKPVKLDSLEAKVDKRGLGTQKDSFEIFVIFQDPLNETNYYRIKSSINGVSQDAEGKNFNVWEDRLTNGNRIRIPNFSTNYSLNDNVEMELVSIDKKMYDYFNTLSKIIGQQASNSAAPTNPSTNWSNGAYGYFGAFSSTKRSIIVR